MKLLLRCLFMLFFTLILLILVSFYFSPLFCSDSVIIPYAIYPFDICIRAPNAWKYLKFFYVITFIFSSLICSNIIFTFITKNKSFRKVNPSKTNQSITSLSDLNLYIGKSSNNEPVYLNENGLYQNILITGTIGSGKTSSAMYPFTEQLMQITYHGSHKIGMLILDVKGNYYNQVKKYALACGRISDLRVIELGGGITYNPLDKPTLKPNVLANRLKTILMLFSPENSESYWLDTAENILAECIKLCRLYNNGYVTFTELHKLINSHEYYEEKVAYLKGLFLSGKFSDNEVYDLYSAISFFEDEFKNLDSRVFSILKSEISRMTNIFISDYDVLKTFSPEKENLNFSGFKEVIEDGKIVVLNMNIALYKNLSKFIAAYLKLDFQSEVLAQLSKGIAKPCAFISDEFHEYVTATDADFFAQSREAKCINIVATQSYTSLLNSLKNQPVVNAITQNLINKLWFRTDDSSTIESAQKQIGKEDKTKISKSISENAQETNYNYLTNSLSSKGSNVSESISTSVSLEYVYDTKFFTQELEAFSCLAFLSNGYKVIPPQKLKMKPYFSEGQNDFKKSKYKII